MEGKKELLDKASLMVPGDNKELKDTFKELQATRNMLSKPMDNCNIERLVDCYGTQAKLKVL